MSSLGAIHEAPSSSDLLAALSMAVGGTLREHRRLPRLHEIFVRCDINQESRKAVAADIGLSLRQLHRELRFARNSVSRMLDRIGAEPGDNESGIAVTYLLESAVLSKSYAERLALLLQALRLMMRVRS